MLNIKKVAVTPLPENEGKIIDSFNTTDNKHTNAPSINAVEEKMELLDQMLNYTLFTGNIITEYATVNLDSSGMGSVDIAYPDGLNKNNCVPISWGIALETYNFGYGNAKATALIDVILKDNNITVGVKATGYSGNNRVKIVLLQTTSILS